MTARLCAGACGLVFGFVLAWAQVTDPAVIRAMLRLQEPDVFLIMGSAIAVAAGGSWLLRAVGAHAWVTGDPIAWTLTPPGARHVVGSVIFGAGWSIAATCPGPVTAMIGQGRLGGLVVVAGLALGVALEGRADRHAPAPAPARIHTDAGCV